MSQDKLREVLSDLVHSCRSLDPAFLPISLQEHLWRAVDLLRRSNLAEADAAKPEPTPNFGPAKAWARRVTIPYTNRRGKFAMREIAPLRMFWGSNEWHPDPQWLIEAWNIAKSEIRTFALSGIGARRTSQSEVAGERELRLEALLREAREWIGFEPEHSIKGLRTLAKALRLVDRIDAALRDPAPASEGRRDHG